jgi:hypothetical protein
MSRLRELASQCEAAAGWCEGALVRTAFEAIHGVAVVAWRGGDETHRRASRLQTMLGAGANESAAILLVHPKCCWQFGWNWDNSGWAIVGRLREVYGTKQDDVRSVAASPSLALLAANLKALALAGEVVPFQGDDE